MQSFFTSFFPCPPQPTHDEIINFLLFPVAVEQILLLHLFFLSFRVFGWFGFFGVKTMGAFLRPMFPFFNLPL